MQRVMVIGPCGAGKSTISRILAKKFALPLFHIDQLHWKPNWTAGSDNDLRASLTGIVAQQRWIIDGNYLGTVKQRLERADTVIYLDYPIRLCLWRAIKRLWRYRRKVRPDMGQGCPERIDLEFLLYILNWNRRQRPQLERQLKNASSKVLRFQNAKALDDWLDEALAFGRHYG